MAAPRTLVHEMDAMNSTTRIQPRAMVTIKGDKKRKPLRFREGGLHVTTGTPGGEKIPQAKMQAAARGEYGPQGVKQANFAMHALHAGQQTAARNRRRLRT